MKRAWCSRARVSAPLVFTLALAGCGQAMTTLNLARLEAGRSQKIEQIALFRQHVHDLGGPARDAAAGAVLARVAQRLGNEAGLMADLAGGDWAITLVDDGGVGGFVGPDGLVGMRRDTLTLMNDEAEVAAVAALVMTRALSKRDKSLMGLAGAPSWTAALVEWFDGLWDIDDDALALLLGLGWAPEEGEEDRPEATSADAKRALIDRLVVRWLAAAGYDPGALASAFERWSRLRRIGGAGPDREFIDDPRITRARELASEMTTSSTWTRGVAMIDVVDGLAWGNARHHVGDREGRRVFKALLLEINPPKDWRVQADRWRVTLEDVTGGRVVFIDADFPVDLSAQIDAAATNGAPPKIASVDATQHLLAIFADRLDGPPLVAEPGFAFGRGRLIATPRGRFDVWMAAIALDDGRMGRMIAFTPEGSGEGMRQTFEALARSVRAARWADTAIDNADHVAVVTVAADDDAGALMPRGRRGRDHQPLFAVINGLADGARPSAGARVKIIQRRQEDD